MLIEQLQPWLEEHKGHFKFLEHLDCDDLNELFQKKSTDHNTIADIMWPAILASHDDEPLFCIPSKLAYSEFREDFKLMCESLNINLPLGEHTDLANSQ